MSGFKRGVENIRPPRRHYSDSEKGPWFAASFSGGECSDCGAPIHRGDLIRADGEGGWECPDLGVSDRSGQEGFDRHGVSGYEL